MRTIEVSKLPRGEDEMIAQKKTATEFRDESKQSENSTSVQVDMYKPDSPNQTPIYIFGNQNGNLKGTQSRQ